MHKNIRIISRLLCLMTVLIILAACINEIPFENQSNLDRINISGQLTDILEEQKVEIREVANLNQESTVVGDPIENAEVYIEDNNGQRIRFFYKASGIYSARVQGFAGMSYKLVVRNDDGKSYESVFSKMNKNAPLDSISAVPFTEKFVNSNGSVNSETKVGVQLTTLLHNGDQPIHTLYRVSGEYEFQEDDIRIAPLRTCFITQNFDFSNVLALSGSELPNHQIVDKRIFSISHDYRYAYNFCFLVEQYAVDPQTYEYWKNIQKLTELKRSVFDPPPGRIASNINCISNPNDQVFGFFTVGSKTSKRTFTNSLKLGLAGQYYCKGFSAARKPAGCIDCRIFSNSTTQRPAYWPF